jgi:hypothetical protein
VCFDQVQNDILGNTAHNMEHASAESELGIEIFERFREHLEPRGALIRMNADLPIIEYEDREYLIDGCRERIERRIIFKAQVSPEDMDTERFHAASIP